MKKLTLRLARVVVGLFLFALGIVMSINAGLGVAPWDVFHQGLSNHINITMGMASIMVGAVVVILNVILGQSVGWATIMNMLLIGIFMDVLMLNNLIPSFNGFLASLTLLIIGLFIEGVGCWLYISAGLGAGPRDGLMVILTKRSGKSVRLVKTITEIGATAIGYLLGGSLGLGTLIMAVLGGPIFQYVFKLIKFDVKGVEHRFIQDDIKFIKEKLKAKVESEM